MAKPVSTKGLAESTGKWFNVEDRQEDEQTSSEVQGMVKDLAILNHGDLMARIDNDKQLYQMVLEMFLEKTPQTLTELQNAIEQKDSENIHFLAHRLKGTTANLGAEILKKSALALEQLGKSNNHIKADAIFKDIKAGYADLEKEINNTLAGLDKDN